MQTNIDPLVVVYMNRHFPAWVQGCSTSHLKVLEVGPDHVIRLASGKALCEFSLMVRDKLPLCLFVPGSADLYLDAIDGTIVRSPDSSEDEGVGVAWFGLLLRLQADWVCNEVVQGECDEQKGKESRGPEERKAPTKD